MPIYVVPEDLRTYNIPYNGARMVRYIKDPDEVLDYNFNWANWLGTDTISTSGWTVATGLTEDSDSETTTVTTVWLSGGTVNEEYEISNEIETVAGRTAIRTAIISVEAR